MGNIRPTLVLRSIVIVLVLLISAGCATTRNFELLPQAPEDFELEYADLSSKFKDVPNYEKMFRAIPPNTPYLEDLTDVWGLADYEKTHWSQLGWAGGSFAGLYLLTSSTFAVGVAAGLVLIIDPLLPKTYVWHKGNYCIEVVTNSAFHNFSYKKRVQYWTWTDLRNAEELSDVCKEVLQNRGEDINNQ